MALVSAGLGVLLLPGLGAAPLVRAEIYFMDAARGMAESGDWLVPRYRGEPFFDKPALTYWLMAASFRAFGATLGAGRLVAVLAAIGLLAATAWLGRLVLDRRSALLGIVALATTLLVLSFGRVAMSDMLLALWCTLALAVGVWAAAGGASTGRMALLGALLGAGFLTKGPIALVLTGPSLALLAWRGIGPARLRPRPAAMAAAAAAFGVTGLGWFAVLGWRLGPAPLEYFFLRENLERFAGEAYDTGRSPLFYIWAYLASGLPWSLLFPLAAWRRRREGAFLLLWMVLMAIPLTLSRGKIDYYLLPLLPPASLVIGAHLASRWEASDRAWARGTLLAFAVIVLMPSALVARVPTGWLPFWPAHVALVVLGAIAALTATAASIRPTPARLTAVLAGGTAATYLLLAAVFLPAFRAAQPNAEVVEDVRRERAWRPDARLAVCADPVRATRDLLFELRVAAQERCDVWNPASSRLPFLLMVAPEQWRTLQAVPGIREVATYRSVPAAALSLGQLVAGVEEDPFVLVANYPTDDPVAETKRKRDRKRALRLEAAAATR